MERKEKNINPAMLPLIPSYMEQAQEEKEGRKYISGKLKYVDLKSVVQLRE
jgi:hypothetical protein